MRRTLPLLVALLAAAPAFAQSQGGASAFGFGAQGLKGGGRSGISGTLGPETQIPPPPNTPTAGTYPDLSACAPGQARINAGPCQPQEWIKGAPPSTYDQSVEGLAPLRDLTLD
ncbi:hypothetical protein [Enterovirga rhinocerotis]|uniref:Uncharacterized protein n=1 Tax=Enterovirga rhinocerotis TaxID=1339210 RepID=A0A4R7C5A3_9HYPH|nr:hypothetical protein [Enterovirga rhinocerotis]TDR93351.1 hypothetical protein EV668_0609 [Enterovirga rhinocerotis]